jgi:hypothetical protein
MNPALLSLLTTLLTSGATSIATWLVTKGFLQASDESTFVTSLVSLGVTLAGFAAVAIWKMLQHTKVAQIAAVNDAKNGVKVVDENDPAPKVTEPLK